MRRRALCTVNLFLLCSAVALASDIPVRNWPVPLGAFEASGKAVDATPPRPFIGLPPCRIVDTRGNGAPIQGGMFAGPSDVRTWALVGQCGVPAGTDAVSLNFTVVASTSAGFLTAWPAGGTVPPVSIVNFSAGQTIANASILPLGAGEAITVNVSAPVHVLLDVNGYFSDTLGTPGNSFNLSNNSSALTMRLHNASTSCGATCGLLVTIASNAGARAIRGSYEGTGVGQGVYGDTNVTNDSAGVYGLTSNPAADTTVHFASGVKGSSAIGQGVLGVSEFVGVRGILTDATGATLANGILGFAAGGTNYGVYSLSNYGGSGAKFFVEPHPETAGMVIRYVALEGPESGTYFRGRGKFERGIATIEVPESFRLVTDAEGLSVQVTPIGEMASFAVLSMGLDKIVVKGSRNVGFFYTVNGVRRSHKHLTPIGPGTEFMPETAEATMPAYFTDVQKQMLISNGTYKEDGTVNMETAQRLGWDRVWKAQAEQRSKIPQGKD